MIAVVSDEFTDRVWVGFVADLDACLAAMTGDGVSPRLVLKIDADEATAARLRERFADLDDGRGEGWHRPGAEILAFVAEAAAKAPLRGIDFPWPPFAWDGLEEVTHSAACVLAYLKANGHAARAEGRMMCVSPKVADPRLREAIKTHKESLLDLLSVCAWLTPEEKRKQAKEAARGK